jgi:hypothetical protein
MHELTHILTAFGLIVIISSMVGFVMLVGVFPNPDHLAQQQRPRRGSRPRH